VADKARKEAYDKKWRQENRARVNRRARLTRYGLTEEQYDILDEAQGSACAICRGPQIPVRTQWGTKVLNFDVDHDHATGRVRGLLCRHCNLALGYLKDNPERAEAAAAYLRRGR